MSCLGCGDTFGVHFRQEQDNFVCFHYLQLFIFAFVLMQDQTRRTSSCYVRTDEIAINTSYIDLSV